jgi:hypothetical protein
MILSHKGIYGIRKEAGDHMMNEEEMDEYSDLFSFTAALPMVHEAVEQIRSAFSELRYYPPKDIRDSLCPEQMTTEQLAAALNELVSDFDFYDYQDNFNPEEDIVETMAMELRCGKAHTGMPEQTYQMYFTIYYADKDKIKNI